MRNARSLNSRTLGWMVLYMSTFVCGACSQVEHDHGGFIGSWAHRDVEGSANNVIVFDFTDSTCIYSASMSPPNQYVVLGDTLAIRKGRVRTNTLSPSTVDARDEWIAFNVRGITDDSLVLMPREDAGDRQRGVISSQLEYPIRLSRLSQISEIRPMHLQMVSTSCLGSCPELFVQVSPNGEVAYEGINFVAQEGWYRGNIKSKDLEYLWERAAQVDWNALLPAYAVQSTDYPSYSIRRILGADTVSTVLYGLDAAPPPLQILVGHLLNVRLVARLDPYTSPPQSAMQTAHELGSAYGMPPSAYNRIVRPPPPE